MPLYEYYCPTCAGKFEKLQRTRSAEETAVCPSGHAGATRTLSLFATFTRGAHGDTEMMSSGGGCVCGGSCACGGGMSRN